LITSLLLMIRSFCAPAAGCHEGPDVADADAALVDDRVLLEHRLVEGDQVLRMHQEGLRLVAVDDLLHGEGGLAPLLLVELGALLLGQLVVFLVDVADEVVALLGVARMVERVEELVGIAALGPADHAPRSWRPTCRG
jgi:hypothetical protein